MVCIVLTLSFSSSVSPDLALFRLCFLEIVFLKQEAIHLVFSTTTSFLHFAVTQALKEKNIS
jgi:hypothetical protein